MKRIILTTMALAFSLSSLADQSQSMAVAEGTSGLLAITSIENKNQGIMSSYKAYFQISQKHNLLKKTRIHKQYSQFIESKQAFSGTASL